MFETKSGGAFEVKELGDGAGWTVTGYASTFGGQPDHAGDVIAKGAFAESIASRKTKFLYQHQDPIGVQVSLVEDQHGLLGTWEIVPTALGTDAHMLAKAGVLDSLSIGFLTKDAEFRDDGVRVIKSVDLLEVSLVTFPANENAVVTAVKSAVREAFDAETRATWTTSYINDLPDSAFAVILPGGEKDGDGKTTPRSLRKLPHHAADGKLDMAHLRNAMSREPQSDMPEEAHTKAHAHLMRHANDTGMGKSDDDLLDVKGYGLTLDEHIERVRDAALDLMERLEAGMARRVKEGRAISEGRRTRLAASSGKLRESSTAALAVADEIDALLEETAPPSKAEGDPPKTGPAIDIGYQLALRRNRLRGRVELPA